MANVRNRRISLRQYMIARFCPRSAFTTEYQRQLADSLRTADRSHRKLVKDVARELLQDDQKRAAVHVQEKVAAKTFSEQKTIIREARKIATARLAGLEEGDDLEMGAQNEWFDKETGWTIVFQPNRVEVLTDEEGDYVRVLGWTDKRFVRVWQMEMARMFGLMQYIQEKGEFRIKMVMQSLLKNKTLWEDTLDSPQVALEQLKETQAVLNKLEKTLVSGEEPSRIVGKHCYGCPIKLACNQGKKFMKRDQEASNTKRYQDNKPARKAA